ncbi:hypothetical protein ACOSQ2_016563 [Xanthoceras sorbifolium]
MLGGSQMFEYGTWICATSPVHIRKDNTTRQTLQEGNEGAVDVNNDGEGQGLRVAGLKQRPWDDIHGARSSTRAVYISEDPTVSNLHAKKVTASPNYKISANHADLVSPTFVEQFGKDKNCVVVLNDDSVDNQVSQDGRSNEGNGETLHGTNTIQCPPNINVGIDLSLKEGLLHDQPTSNMNIDGPLTDQISSIDKESTKPTRIVRWKQITREAKNWVAGPEHVARKGKRSTEVCVEETTAKKLRLDNSSMESIISILANPIN